MGKLVAVALIWNGGVTLLILVLMAIGGMEVMVKLFLPIMLGFAPLNEELLAWVEIPLAMAIQGKLLNVTTYKEDGYLGCGIIEFQATLAGGGYDSAEFPVVPALFVEEDAEIDEVVRYFLNAGPYNYPSIFFWICSLGSFFGLIAAIVHKFLTKLKDSLKDDLGGGEATVATPPPNPTTIQVIPMDDASSFK